MRRDDDSFDIVSSSRAGVAGDMGAAPVHKKETSDGSEDDDDGESDWE
jgi:hypothetical protein